MANTNVVIIYDQLQSAVTKLEGYYTMLEEQQKMISRLDTYFDYLYKIHGKNTTFTASMEDKIQNMAAAIKNDMADIDYLKNLINYIVQSYTDAEGKTTLRSNELLMTALGSLVPYSSSFTTSIYGNMGEYSTAIQADATKAADVSQYSKVENWRTYASTNAQTADAWDAVHDNSSTNGEKYSYKISTTGSKISTNAQNVAIQDTNKDVQEANDQLKEAERKIAEAEQKAEAAEQRAQEAEQKAQEAEARVEEKPEDTYTETKQTEKKATTQKETPVTKEPAQKEKTVTKDPTPKTENGGNSGEEGGDIPTEKDPNTMVVDPPTIEPTEPTETEDPLPTPVTKKSSSGNKVVPIIAGVAAAGAAGVGAKVFLDKKSGNTIDDENWEESGDEYNEDAFDEEDKLLDSSDEFTYKTDLDEDYINTDTGEDNFSDVTEEDEVQGYQAINFNDISETH